MKRIFREIRHEERKFANCPLGKAAANVSQKELLEALNDDCNLADYINNAENVINAADILGENWNNSNNQ